MNKLSIKNFIILVFMCICVFIISGYTLYASPVYIYGDGNGNTYILSYNIKGKILEYKPIKPENSSSGEYDGGKYLKKKINDLQYQNIILEIDKAVKNKKIHIKNRVKMSGMINITKNKNHNTYILKPGSKELLNIEKALKNLILK